MYHSPPTVTRPSLWPLRTLKTKLGARGVWRCCVRRVRRSKNLRQYTCNAQDCKTTSVPFYVPSIAPSRHCWFSLYYLHSDCSYRVYGDIIEPHPLISNTCDTVLDINFYPSYKFLPFSGTHSLLVMAVCDLRTPFTLRNGLPCPSTPAPPMPGIRFAVEGKGQDNRTLYCEARHVGNGDMETYFLTPSPHEF